MTKITIAVGRLGAAYGPPELHRRSGLEYVGGHYDAAKRVYIPVADLPRLIEDGYITTADLGYGSLCLLVQESRGLWRERWYVWLGDSGMAKYYFDAAALVAAPETIEQEELSSADLPF